MTNEDSRLSILHSLSHEWGPWVPCTFDLLDELGMDQPQFWNLVFTSGARVNVDFSQVEYKATATPGKPGFLGSGLKYSLGLRDEVRAENRCSRCDELEKKLKEMKRQLAGSGDPPKDPQLESSGSGSNSSRKPQILEEYGLL